MIPTPEQILRIINQGTAARVLLREPHFADLMNDLDQFHLSALVACPTGQVASPTRDYHHERLHALREIIDEVTARAQALDAYEAEQSSSSDEFEEDQE